MKLIGLDFEASGSDPWQKHVPIQIGVALEDGSEFESLIGGWRWHEFEWSQEAEGVHSITQAELEQAEPAWKVDIRLAAWLLDRVGSRMWNIPVGWNVAGYDRQFITRWMPNVNRLLSYRSIDLGALCFMLGKGESGYNRYKREAKEYSLEKMQLAEDAFHNALVDARSALYCYEYLRDRCGS